MPSDLPPNSSPLIAPIARPSASYLPPTWHDPPPSQPSTPSLPNIISPSFTPPATQGTHTPSRRPASPKSTPVDTSLDPPLKPARLADRLPTVECIVRARIPTTSGTEMFLHLYQNDTDSKEHLAIVFGNNIRSRSLDCEREGESEMDRMIRGAYVGRLRPGRVSSRVDPSRPKTGRVRSGSALKHEVGVESVPEDEVLEIQTETQGSIQPTVRSQDVEGTTDADESLAETLEHVHLRDLRPPLVRIHSECYTGETAWSARCDCGEQLDEAARLMSLPTSTGGVIVYLRQEGRGIGLAEKLKAYNIQDLGSDTVEANLLLRHPADARTYGLATAILQDLGLGTDSDEGKEDAERGIRLLTNNPDKVRAVEGPNKEVRVRERVAMVPIAWKTKGREGVRGKEIERYLETKIGRMGHMIKED